MKIDFSKKVNYSQDKYKYKHEYEHRCSTSRRLERDRYWVGTYDREYKQPRNIVGTDGFSD